MVVIFLANRAAMVASIVLSIVVLAAIFGPMLHPVDPFEMVWAPFTPPGQDGFVLGTDYLGRDMLAALLNGGRVSLTIGLVAALMSV
ncbi:MAG: ABC transporter permease, partial [Rhodospirillaceae bacterium]|nr:ABC transporter permease [Rhodospirillaceae bacterium]